ncbi:hypothetical protein BCR36DRAFT_411040 [Piromyces finnis]|uniref:Uncharacterized protein n=1 Tax=Piromyces finnis TaxID=1754191 RepID=A0A1Y1VG18_9FUNG|nr:hypothetical protein BCR36DRAFT_411040 [Piromyces finnis]|eukprot:ORX53901.1 hypothetical protein BCR36DRAFT_411040 [Piromyces finnis]
MEIENKDTKIKEPIPSVIPISNDSKTEEQIDNKKNVLNLVKKEIHQEKEITSYKIKEDIKEINRENEININKNENSNDKNSKDKPSLQETHNNNEGIIPLVKTKEFHSPLTLEKLDYPCYPNNQEFENPLNYIETLNLKLRDKGACKIIPPTTWTPTNLSNFKECQFEAKNNFFSQEKMNYCRSYNEKLLQFHEQNGYKIPQIDNKPIDFERIKIEIAKRNGYPTVCKEKKWSEIGRAMSSGEKPNTTVSSIIKQAYIRWILPYEYYLKHQEEVIDQTNCFICHDKIIENTEFLKCNCCEHLYHFDCIAKEENETIKNNNNNGTSINDSGLSSPLLSNSIVNSKTIKNWICSMCYEMTSLPSFYEISKKDKEERNQIQRQFNLDSFENYANKFKNDYFSLPSETPQDHSSKIVKMDIDSKEMSRDDHQKDTSYNNNMEGIEQEKIKNENRDDNETLVKNENGKGDSKKETIMTEIKDRSSIAYVSEQQIEKEFWNLMKESSDIIIKSGYHLINERYGSGFPTFERDPLNQYSFCGWNLNNLPFLPNSLLNNNSFNFHNIETFIPHVNFGMCFNYVPWSFSNYYTYYIDFLHHGESRLWYIIPPSEMPKVESLLKSSEVDLKINDSKTKIPFLFSPQNLLDSNIKVQTVIQKKGEFLLIHPQTYYCYIDLGYNISENVNFLLPSWLSYGRKYLDSTYQKTNPMSFSFEHLVLTSAKSDTNSRLSHWLNKELDLIVVREQTQRDDLFKNHPTIETKRINNNNNNKYEIDGHSFVQCQFCHRFCYISYIMHNKNQAISCLEHYHQLMENDKKESIQLYERYSMDELNSIHKHIQKLSSRVSDWRKKYKKYMKENKYPSIIYLQQLLSMTEKFPYTIKEIHSLKNYLKVVNAWLEEANQFLLRDKRNANKENLKPRSLNQIKILIDKADIYSFESQEIKALKSLYDAVTNYQARVSSFLKNPEIEKASLNDVKELVKEGRNLDVDIYEMKELELLYENLIWRRESDLVIVDGKIEADYKTVNKLIDMAKECNIPPDNKIFKDLCHEKEIADDWKTRAEKLMEQSEIDLNDLETLLDEINDIPNIEGLMEDLHNMKVKAEDYIKLAKMYIDDDDDNDNDNEEEEEKEEEGKKEEKKKESEKEEKEEEEVVKKEDEELNNENLKAQKSCQETILENESNDKEKNETTPHQNENDTATKEVQSNTKDAMILEHSNNKEIITPMVEENDHELYRHFDNDHEEDEETVFEDSMDISKEDYQKIKKNKEKMASKYHETSKFDLKYILNNNSNSSEQDSKEIELDRKVNQLVYQSIRDAVDEIKKENEHLSNLPHQTTTPPSTIECKSKESLKKPIYELPERKINIKQWKEIYGLDENYKLKELKKSSSKKKNDRKNKKKKTSILTMENFKEFLTTLNSQKVKIDIQQSLNNQYHRIESLFEKGKTIFESEENHSFNEILNEVFENIKNCVQTLNLMDESSSSASSPIMDHSSEHKLPQKNDKSKTGMNSGKDSKNKKRNHSAKNVYCFCRTMSEGFMVACDICNEWYHGQCLKLSKKDTKSKKNFICPLCDLNQPRYNANRKRPTLEDLENLIKEFDSIKKIFIPEKITLVKIIELLYEWRENINEYLLKPFNTLSIENIKSLIRNTEGMMVDLPIETEILYSVLKNILKLQEGKSKRKKEKEEMEKNENESLKEESADEENGKVDSAKKNLTKRPSLEKGNNQMKKKTNKISNKANNKKKYYCICQQEYDKNNPMIACDHCQEWYHFSCIGLSEDKVDEIDQFICHICKERLNEESKKENLKKRKNKYSNKSTESIVRECQNPLKKIKLTVKRKSEDQLNSVESKSSSAALSSLEINNRKISIKKISKSSTKKTLESDDGNLSDNPKRSVKNKFREKENDSESNTSQDINAEPELATFESKERTDDRLKDNDDDEHNSIKIKQEASNRNKVIKSTSNDKSKEDSVRPYRKKSLEDIMNEKLLKKEKQEKKKLEMEMERKRKEEERELKRKLRQEKKEMMEKMKKEKQEKKKLEREKKLKEKMELKALQQEKRNIKLEEKKKRQRQKQLESEMDGKQGKRKKIKNKNDISSLSAAANTISLLKNSSNNGNGGNGGNTPLYNNQPLGITQPYIPPQLVKPIISALSPRPSLPEIQPNPQTSKHIPVIPQFLHKDLAICTYTNDNIDNSTSQYENNNTKNSIPSKDNVTTNDNAENNSNIDAKDSKNETVDDDEAATVQDLNKSNPNAISPNSSPNI